MSRIPTFITGVSLVLVGGLLLAYNVVGSVFGLRFPQLWPLAVGAVGLMFILSPVIWIRQRGLGALFIPGMPILAVAAVGMFSNFVSTGRAWSTFWPVIIIGLALGFVLAAIFMRVIWLLIPAFLIGFIGAALQFSTITGWWVLWAGLWVVAPLGVGLALLLISVVRRSGGLFLTGLVISGSTVGMAAFMIMVLSRQWTIASALMGFMLMPVGVLLVGRHLLTAPQQPMPQSN